MSEFKRKFAIENEKVGDDPLMADLLLLWRPAGAAAGEHGLRLAIRNGYINLYRAGQSVAKVSVPDGQVEAKVHGKYIDKEQTSQKLKTFHSQDYGGKDEIRKWIHEANDKAGDEKKFVDLLVGHNPNVIDLEMALPFDQDVAYKTYENEAKRPGAKMAVRMDLVCLEKIDQAWTIVFWEAKLANNPEARRAGDALPKVKTQLDKYTGWIEKNRETVINEYIDTCQLLFKFHSLASKTSLNIPPLGEGIITVAREKRLSLDARPRLIIDNRKRADKVKSLSFEKNGHLAKLRNAEIHVQMVETDGDFVLESRH